MGYACYKYIIPVTICGIFLCGQLAWLCYIVHLLFLPEECIQHWLRRLQSCPCSEAFLQLYLHIDSLSLRLTATTVQKIISRALCL